MKEEAVKMVLTDTPLRLVAKEMIISMQNNKK